MPEMEVLLKKFNKNLKDYKLDEKLNYFDFENEIEFRE